MKKIVWFAIGFMFWCGNVHAELTVMSFNIRYGTANDGDNSWKFRTDLVIDTIEKYDAEIIGMQEALKFQIQEIIGRLGYYQSVGVGREDGLEEGEFSNILYDSSRVKLVETGTFWLSDTPTVPGSITWGNACTRICTWALFRQQKTDKTFYVFNVHLDHVSQPSREKSIELVLTKVNQLGDVPCIITGDFNAGENNPGIQYLLNNSNFKDSYRVLHPNAENVGTFNSFTGKNDGDKIDYIFNSGHFQVKKAEILHDHVNSRYPSDHFPVLAEFEWK